MKRFLLLCVLCALCGSFSFSQLRGSPELAQALARLPFTGTVLHTGAHPDDEASTMLAYLARGRHVHAAYLSATRGDGGQNLLGLEQYEAMGLLRTQELLDARRLDGAEQFFTRAFDFGFSKSAQESFEKWGHEEILADFVRIIRTYRPDVIVARFVGGPSDGHGQHQASGTMTADAFRAAADPARFPAQIREGLRPWQAKKLYQTVNRFGPTANDPLPEGAIALELGDYDPVLGASYEQIGSEGRVLHRSQGFAGFAGRIGPSIQGLTLRESVLPKMKETDIFDGIDNTLGRFTALGASPADVAALQQIVMQVLAQYRQDHPEKIALLLAQGLSKVRLMTAAANADLGFYLERKAAEFEDALALSQGVTMEALADRGEFVPGQAHRVTVNVWNRSPDVLSVPVIGLSAPAGWKVQAAEFTPGEIAYNHSATRVFTVTPPVDAPVSQPYWLVSPRQGDRFVVADPKMIGRPESPALMTAHADIGESRGEIRLDVAGNVPISAPVIYRMTDPIYGQRDTRVNLVPAVAAWTEPAALIFPPGEQREVKVRLRNNAAAAATGKFSLSVPAGWSVEPREQAFAIAHTGEESAFVFHLRPGANAKAGVAAVAAPYQTGYQVINYPHIVPQYWFHPAETKLRPVDLKMAPNRKVGYIMGPGDEVPAALKQLGVNLTMLEADDLLSGDLSKYDVIVAGIRTYTVRQDLVVANQRLLQYVNNGGVFIVQYQGSSFTAGQPFPYGPYPMQYDRPQSRVTVEEAPVAILAPGDALFNTPNKITAADFDGWVQERGLNFMGTWDSHYTPLMSCNDPGEAAQKGGMLEVRYGKGLYLYTGYAWFRQLPAGVPGAYRIWANLLSWK